METERQDLISRRRQPRQNLLRGANIMSDLRLQAFVRQHVAPIGCDEALAQLTHPEGIVPRILSDDPVTTERREAVSELARYLFAMKWVIHGGAGAMPCTTNGPDVRIWLDPAASERTTLAAQALASVLHDALLLEGDNPPVSTWSFDRHTLTLLAIDDQEKPLTFIVLFGDKRFQ